MRHRQAYLALVAVTILAATATASAGAGRLTAAERLGIDRTLDRFVPEAVRRDDSAAAYALAAPAMRVGTTLGDWRRGEIPVYPYPAQGRHFHYWTFSYRTRREVAVELQLHSRHPTRIGPITFKVSLQKIRGRWLVSSFMPAATFAPVGAPPKVRSQADFAAGSMNEPTRDRRRLGEIWILVPLSVLGLSVLLALGYPLFKWQLERRVG